MSGPLHHVILGEPRHGVTRLGLELLPLGCAPTHLPAIDSPDDAAAAARLLPPVKHAPALHLHVTDGLLGSDPARAMALLTAGRRVAMTLHDLPQPAEGEARYVRRSRQYRELAALAELILVCSDHERRCLSELGTRTPVAVVDHPIDARHTGTAPVADQTVGVLGWIHPGKGHAEVLQAIAEAIPGGTMVALGAPSPGHPEHLDELRATASRLGVGLRVTGYLRREALLARAAEMTVPVCAHHHVSASGTIGTWMSAGRAPIVRDGPYARELASRCSGAVVLADDLAAAFAHAVADPWSTVLHRAVAVGPSTAEARERQSGVLAAWMTA